MKATAEKIEKNKVLLEVEVEAENFDKCVTTACKNIVKKVNIPGFRQGRAPKVILEQYVGKEVICEEAMEILLPDAYVEAIEQTGIKPVGKPDVEVVQSEEGKPAIFKVKVTVRPEVALGQYSGLEATKKIKEIGDENVQKELENLQNRHAELESIEEGVVGDKDVCVIDFEGKIDGIPFQGGTAADYSLEVGSNTFIPGFEEQMLGMNVGETKDLLVNFPENYGKDELNGKEATFTVTVKLIKRKKLAELDDEFAKDISEFDTLEELKADILNKLKTEEETGAERMVRVEILDKATENSEIEMPDEMIDQYLEEMIENMRNRMSSQGMTLEMYLQYTGSNMEELRRRYRPDAEKDARRELVIDAIAKAEGISVTEEDMDNEIKKMCDTIGQSYDVLKKFIDQPGQKEFIKNNVLRDKVMDLLMKKATIKEEIA